jgi:hypothetical protein
MSMEGSSWQNNRMEHDVTRAGRLAPVIGNVAIAEASFADKDIEWQKDALCAETDPEAFHPDKGGSNREAKKVCSRCNVRSQCLEYALDNDERHGIWGGLSERERRRLRKQAK